MSAAGLKCQIAAESSLSNDLMLELDKEQHEGPAARQLSQMRQQLLQREEEIIKQQCRCGACAAPSSLLNQRCLMHHINVAGGFPATIGWLCTPCVLYRNMRIEQCFCLHHRGTKLLGCQFSELLSTMLTVLNPASTHSAFYKMNREPSSELIN